MGVRLPAPLIYNHEGADLIRMQLLASKKAIQIGMKLLFCDCPAPGAIVK